MGEVVGQKKHFLLWWVFGACFYLLVSLLFINLPVSPDHTLFDYIGWTVNQGSVPYLDSADQNWPGPIFLHTISTALFGSEMWSFRLFELIFIIPFSAFGLYLFVRHIIDQKFALVVIPLFVLMYTTLGMWSSGQRDLIAAPFLILACYCLLLRFEGGHYRLLIFQGLCLAAVVLIRPTLLIMAPILTLLDFALMRKTGRPLLAIVGDHFMVAVSIILPVAILALIAIPSGALAAWFKISILFNLEVYSFSLTSWQIVKNMLNVFIQSWQWYVLWSAFGIYCLSKLNSTALILILGVFPATLISALVQAKGFGYHFLPLIPLMAVLITFAFHYAYETFKDKKKSQAAKVVAIFIVLLPVLGLGKKMMGRLEYQRQYLLGEISKLELYGHYPAAADVSIQDTYEISEYIKATTAKDRTVLFWGRPTHVNNLTQQYSPFFAASYALLTEPTSSFSLFEEWYEDITKIMKNDPPAVILLVHQQEKNTYMWLPEPSETKKISDIIFNNLDKYTHEKTFGSTHFYRLQE